MRNFFFLLFGFALHSNNSFGGDKAPPLTEGILKENIQRIEATKANVLPGDNNPRLLRLAAAKYQLGNFYNEKKRFSDADLLFAETFSIVSKDKSEAGLDSYRYYADGVANLLLNRNDLKGAKKYIDIAVSICRENDHQKSV